MNDIWQRKEIESPCVKICVMDENSGLCIGCGRTRHEIAGWSGLEPSDRRKVMATLDARLESLKPKRRGGRNARIPKLK